MKLFLFSLLLFLTQIGVCQSTFSKIFGSDSSLLYGGVSITSYNDSIYFSMFEQDLPYSYQATIFVKTDPLGLQTAYNRFYNPQYVFSSGYEGSVRITSEGYLVCGGFAASLAVQSDSAVFFKMARTSLNTIFIKSYSPANISGFNDFNQLTNGNYLFSGLEGDSFTIKIMLGYCKLIHLAV